MRKIFLACQDHMKNALPTFPGTWNVPMKCMIVNFIYKIKISKLHCRIQKKLSQQAVNITKYIHSTNKQ